MAAIPNSREKTFAENEFIVSKTDLKGYITYGNELFIKMSGYTERELLDAPHNILRHPDMPKAVFSMLWEQISRENEIFAFVKNLSKDGSFYWVKAHVTPSYDDSGRIVGYHSVRRKPARSAIDAISGLYKQMLYAESSGGVAAGKRVLEDLLKTKGVSYDEFIFAL